MSDASIDNGIFILLSFIVKIGGGGCDDDQV